MNHVSRRSIMRAGVCGSATLLAGCTSSSSDGSGGGSTREQVIDSREEINEDGYQYFSFDLNRQATFEYEFTVRSGPEIDVFLMDDQEFDEYQGGNRFRVFSGKVGTGGRDTLTLDENSYRLVVDNTNAGEVAPPTNFDDDVVEVEVAAWVEG